LADAKLQPLTDDQLDTVFKRGDGLGFTEFIGALIAISKVVYSTENEGNAVFLCPHATPSSRCL
jgi:hypothetical protein